MLVKACLGQFSDKTSKNVLFYRMVVKKALALLAVVFLGWVQVFGQCNTLTTNRSIDFNTDQSCAPVTVTQFELTYNFSVPQDPDQIEIVYQWNDPANTVVVVNSSNGLTFDPTHRSFTADRTMVYMSNNNRCAIQPTAYIRINGVVCPSSIQTQTAFFWENDEEGNGNISVTPETWDVCYNHPVVNARFVDNSEFNCNPVEEPDNPNLGERHVQFVYGTNHNPAQAIRNLTLNDGGTVPLTNGTGALAAASTRGTAGMPVTAAYFGPIDVIPFPAEGPISVSFPMNAPVDAANLVGHRFEVTLFNWNACNPWNGSTANPNYEDAVLTRGYIEIVAAPQPDFYTHEPGDPGNAKTNFCIGEVIQFNNETPNINGYVYTWEFYDDDAGTTLIGTSSVRDPTFAFSSGGTKRIRLIASNPSAQGMCTSEFIGYVSITPSLTAQIGVTDLDDNPITPDFCQEFAAPLTSFDARFVDMSLGDVTPTTVWRWEFFDENGQLIFEAPSGGGFSSTALGPFDRVFVNRGIYRVRLRVRDDVTGCESEDEVFVRVFEKPQPVFSFNRVCEGSPTMIEDISTLNPTDGDQITGWEWDFAYDGVLFNGDPAYIDERNIEFTFTSAGTHNVALRVTTSAGCSSILSQEVQVDPHPSADFTPDVTSGCSELSVTFTNHAANGQPDAISEFIWEVDEGSGFAVDSVQHPDDPGFSDVFVRNFVNTGTADREYRVRLRVVTVNGCDFVSPPVAITVFPQPRSGFVSLNYSPFNDNCSPVPVSFRVDNQTQSLNPTDYTWKIDDADGPVAEISTGTTPLFQYEFVNSSQLVKDFFVTLRATLPSACYGDSTRTIRISPIPSSDFTIDTIAYTCDKVVLALDATQAGLPEYEWTIAINGVVVYGSTTDGDHLEYEITRSVTLDQSVAISLSTVNITNCESPVTTKHVFIGRTENMNASFTASPAEQTLPSSTVTIVNTSNSGPWTYFWDFGDGTTSTNQFVSSHTYETFGVYTITMEVSNHDCVQTVSREIKINPIPPVLEFDYFPASGCAPLTVNFVNESRYADPTSYVWKFGKNEGTSRAVDPTYTYQQPGLYSVTLSATNLLGDTISLTKEFIIDVKENPVAQFALYPTTPLNVPGEILHTDNRSRNATEYVWDFGDGNTSTQFEPQHKYTEEGSFTVTLIARNGNGCADTTALVSGVTTVNHGQLLVPNAFIPNPTGPGSGDVQHNEVFLPLIRNVTKFQMLIFNRWGELMFESNDPEVGWDGYYRGRLCTQDVYVYRITVEYENGRTITRTGDINLLR